MTLSRPAALAAALLGSALLLGILFPAFVLDNVVLPIALVFWVFWRILQSVDQAFCWGVLIFAGLVFVIARFAGRPGQTLLPAEEVPPPDPSAVLDRIDYWRTSLRVNRLDADRWGIVRESLVKMLVALHAARQPEAAQFEIHDALRQGRIPLPEHVYAYLFPPAPPQGRLARIRQAIRAAPRRWYQRWTGQDVVEYYRSIETVIGFIESSTEAKRGDGHPGDHHD